jgi:formamidopyrimidine-DNA glycosylase
MPEGPEVKIIGEQLSSLLKGKLLTKLKILSGKYSGKCQLLNYQSFSDSLPLRINKIETKGKLIYMILENGWYIFNTLGMSGTYSEKFTKHCHLEFIFCDPPKINKECQLWFYDVRRFGNMYCSQDLSYIKEKLDSIGPDMLSNPPNQTDFIEIYRKRNKINICKVLMDQSQVSGCGNYLKAEILYDSQISPWHIVEDLSDAQLIKLYQSFKKIISRSYQHQGTTLSTYKDVQGTKGNFSQMLKVYGKRIDPKHRDILREKTPDGRSTFWVPDVQK